MCISLFYMRRVCSDNQKNNNKQDKVTENDQVKTLWDFNIQRDCILEAIKPDIIVVEKRTRKCLLINMVVPGDHKIKIYYCPSYR